MSNKTEIYRTELFPNGNDTNSRVGNSYFLDSVWDFNGIHNEISATEGGLQIRFSPIKDSAICLLIKKFLLIHLNKNGFPTAKRTFDGFIRFYKFLKDKYPYIATLKDITPIIIKEYFEYLLIATSEVTGRPLSRNGIKLSSQVVKDILIEGNIRNWKEVPINSNWANSLYKDIILDSNIVKAGYKTNKKLYNNETIKQIISCALNEDDIYTKAGIILQSQIGIRLYELLSICEGCIKTIGDSTVIEIFIRKTKKQTVRRLKPANSLVVQVVNELEEYTKVLRKESGLPYIFIHKPLGKKIRVFCKSNWNRDILMPFVKRWDIKENGRYIELTSHYFRHIFASWAYKKGMPIQSILKMFDHESLRMSEAYIHIKQEEIKNKIKEIFSPDSRIAGVSADIVKEKLKNNNPFVGKTQSQIEIIMDAMRINIRPNGICLHHPLRNDPCAYDGDCVICPNFISPAICLPVHRERVKELENEMARSKAAGNESWYNKNKNLRDHIVNNFIIPLETQVFLNGGDQ